MAQNLDNVVVWLYISREIINSSIEILCSSSNDECMEDTV